MSLKYKVWLHREQEIGVGWKLQHFASRFANVNVNIANVLNI